MINIELCTDLLNTFGKDKYIFKIVEELSELQTAVLHYEDNKASIDDVIDEVVDVSIQLEKICTLLSFDDDHIMERYHKRYDEKTEIIKSLIRREKYRSKQV